VVFAPNPIRGSAPGPNFRSADAFPTHFTFPGSSEEEQSWTWVHFAECNPIQPSLNQYLLLRPNQSMHNERLCCDATHIQSNQIQSVDEFNSCPTLCWNSPWRCIFHMCSLVLFLFLQNFWFVIPASYKGPIVAVGRLIKLD